MEWSALLMREWKGAGPFVTALTFAVFALAMAVTRLMGDRLAEQFGPRPVILRSGLDDGRRDPRLRAGAGLLDVAAGGGCWSASAAATSIR